MGWQNFRELRVWQESKILAIEIYKTTAKGKLSRDYGLRSQIQKSAISIPSNIAEGYERNSNKDFVRFLLIAKGSLSELRTQLEIAQEIGYLDHGAHEILENHCDKLAAMLVKLIQSRDQE